MKEIKPASRIKHQPLTESPQDGSPDATMDDPVYTMDDDEVLMGGEVSTADNIRGNMKEIKPNATIKKLKPKSVIKKRR